MNPGGSKSGMVAWERGSESHDVKVFGTVN